MKEFLQNTRDSFNVWKLAIVKVLLAAFVTGVTTFQTAMSGGVKWDNLDNTDRFLVVAGVLAAMATSIAAFLDKTIARIESGQNPLVEPPEIKITEK